MGSMGPTEPAFATDGATAAYYERRAPEYDEWYEGTGLFARRDRPGWQDDVARLIRVVSGLRPALTVDVACGTGYLTRHLPGPVVALDRSLSMIARARSRLPGRRAVLGDALQVAAADGSFERVFTAHFYGHLPPRERAGFLAEARVGALRQLDSLLLLAPLWAVVTRTIGW